MNSWLRYFAYGSNMHPARLRERTPSCRRLGVASLPGHCLRFHQASATDGSAKCNIIPANDPTALVHGVVYAIPAPERAFLDAAEDLGRGYGIRHLDVCLEGREQSVFCYVALDGTIDDALLPFSWYRDVVLHGARQHGFPAAYIAAIAAQAVIQDKNQIRGAHHRRLLALNEPLDRNMAVL